MRFQRLQKISSYISESRMRSRRSRKDSGTRRRRWVTSWWTRVPCWRCVPSRRIMTSTSGVTRPMARFSNRTRPWSSSVSCVSGVRACMYACACVGVRACLYACRRVWCVCMSVCVSAFVHVYMVCVRACMRACVSGVHVCGVHVCGVRVCLYACLYGVLLKPHETMVQLSVMRKWCACVSVCVYV